MLEPGGNLREQRVAAELSDGQPRLTLDVRRAHGVTFRLGIDVPPVPDALVPEALERAVLRPENAAHLQPSEERLGGRHVGTLRPAGLAPGKRIRQRNARAADEVFDLTSDLRHQLLEVRPGDRRRGAGGRAGRVGRRIQHAAAGMY
jgi:hypothetical protein